MIRFTYDSLKKKFYIINYRNFTTPLLTFYQTGFDALYRHNDVQFSSYDVDNDLSSGGNCATDVGGRGGNWYSACFTQNLNGQYGKEGNAGNKYMFWYNFETSNDFMALKSMRWMAREVV